MPILNEEKITKNDVIIENAFHNSSNILKSSYNFNTNQLVVTFKNGGVYTYSSVTHDEYEGLKLAESSATYLNKTIKPGHSVKLAGKISGDKLNALISQSNEYKLKGS